MNTRERFIWPNEKKERERIKARIDLAKAGTGMALRFLLVIGGLVAGLYFAGLGWLY